MPRRRKFRGEMAADCTGAENADAQSAPPEWNSGGDYPALRIAYCFFVESLESGDGVDGEEDEDEGEDGAAVLPLPAEEDDEDGEDGVADGLLLLGDDGEVRLPLLEPEVEPAPLRSAPRSHAAIRLAPRATETATARVENFMLPP